MTRALAALTLAALTLAGCGHASHASQRPPVIHAHPTSRYIALSPLLDTAASPTVGETLTTTNGTWTGTPTSYAYQWQDCTPGCSNIAGATTASYTIQSSDLGDTIDVTVTATNAYGSTSQTSAQTGTVTSGTCDFTASSSAQLTTDVSAATPGQTVCLNTASYGTWTGTSKAITVAAAPGQSPTMSVSFGNGTGNFTLSGMGGMSGDISGTAANITIQNSTFTGSQTLEQSGAGVVFNQDTFVDFVGTARLWHDSGAATVTVQNSTFSNPNNVTGGADGVRCDAGTTNVLNNDISGVDDAASGNHGDPIQIFGGTCVIKGNYFHAMGGSGGSGSATCSLGEWDGGTNAVFENNVVDGSSNCGDGIGLYSDRNGLVDHNVFFDAPGCTSGFGTDCASLLIATKNGTNCGFPLESPGSGTVIRDNVIGGGVSTCNPGTWGEQNNLSGSSLAGAAGNLGPSTGDTIGSAKFVGGAHPTSWAGFQLCSNSPGVGGASDSTNVGIKLSSGSAC